MLMLRPSRDPASFRNPPSATQSAYLRKATQLANQSHALIRRAVKEMKREDLRCGMDMCVADGVGVGWGLAVSSYRCNSWHARLGRGRNEGKELRRMRGETDPSRLGYVGRKAWGQARAKTSGLERTVRFCKDPVRGEENVGTLGLRKNLPCSWELVGGKVEAFGHREGYRVGCQLCEINRKGTVDRNLWDNVRCIPSYSSCPWQCCNWRHLAVDCNINLAIGIAVDVSIGPHRVISDYFQNRHRASERLHHVLQPQPLVPTFQQRHPLIQLPLPAVVYLHH